MGTKTALRAVQGFAIGAGLLLAPLAMAAGHAPTPKECAAHPTNPAVRGGCIVINRALGNCMACHVIAGTTMDGNLGPRSATCANAIRTSRRCSNSSTIRRSTIPTRRCRRSAGTTSLPRRRSVRSWTSFGLFKSLK